MSTAAFDPRLIAAAVTAAVALLVFVLTKVFELRVAYQDRQRANAAQLMGIKSELELNLEIAKKLLSPASEPRTLGFRFVDDVWKSADRSVLYMGKSLAPDIHAIYAKIIHFYLLAERRAAIRDPANNYSSAEDVIKIERNEMINLARSLEETIPLVIDKLPK